MIKKQRVTKYISILSVSLGIIIATLFSNTREIKAYTNYATDGSWSISTYLQLSAPSQTGQSDIAHLHGTINFNDPSSGSITLNLYNLVSISYSALIENAAISVKNDTKIILNFKECTYIEFDLIIDAQDLLAKLVSKNYASTLNTALTYLRNHEATVFNVKSSTRSTSIDITTDDILIDMNTTMGYIDSDVGEIKTAVQTISTTLSSISNAINNINTYNVKPYMYSAFLLFDAVKTDLTYNTTLSLPVFNVSAGSTVNSTYHIRLKQNESKYFVYAMNDSYHSTYGYVVNGNNTFSKSSGDSTSTSGWHVYYDILTNTSSGTIYIAPTNTVNYTIAPIFIGSLDEMPTEVRNLISINSKETIAINNARDAIVNAINGITVTVENDTEINNYVNANDNSITTITNNHETVNNITNDFNLDFGTADSSITLDIDSLPDLTNTATFWNSKASQVDIELEDFHYPIWLGFVLLAIMAMIGV